MKFSHFFIDRPRFAMVISIMIVIFGALSYYALPVAQYPDIAPPQVQVTASYPGASAETVSDTVATPLEQEINGVQGMLYMSSQSTNDGSMTLSVTFEQGTDIDMAQVLVQNRVSAAETRLPESVRRLGVTTVKNSPDILMVINLYSPDGSYDLNYIGNYAKMQISDKLKRVEGVGGSVVYGSSDYSMRLWFNPDKMASLGLTTQDVIAAVSAQNVQVAGGSLNQQPVVDGKQQAFEMTVQTKGRLIEKEEFEDIIVKSGVNGALVRLKDVARVELGGENYKTNSLLGKDPSVVIMVSMLPGANALDTADLVLSEIRNLSKGFPEGLEYKIIYNPTDYIERSIDEVFETLFIAIGLVIFVIMLFLQSWRIALIPVIAIPISLVGTFAIMLVMGYSLNMLSLFGLVLAIGIVDHWPSSPSG